MDSDVVYNLNVSFDVEAEYFADAEDIADEVACMLDIEDASIELTSSEEPGFIHVRLGSVAVKSLDN